MKFINFQRIWNVGWIFIEKWTDVCQNTKVHAIKSHGVKGKQIMFICKIMFKEKQLSIWVYTIFFYLVETALLYSEIEIYLLTIIMTFTINQNDVYNTFNQAYTTEAI